MISSEKEAAHITRETNIELRYSKLNNEEGIDARVLGEAIIAFSDYSKSITSLTDIEEIKVSVKGIEKGSLLVEFLLFAQQASALIAPFASDANSIIGLLKETISFVKFLGGKPPKSTQSIQGGNVRVENNSGEIITINNNIQNLVLNTNISEDVEKIIRLPLE